MFPFNQIIVWWFEIWTKCATFIKILSSFFFFFFGPLLALSLNGLCGIFYVGKKNSFTTIPLIEILAPVTSWAANNTNKPENSGTKNETSASNFYQIKYWSAEKKLEQKGNKITCTYKTQNNNNNITIYYEPHSPDFLENFYFSRKSSKNWASRTTFIWLNEPK